MGNFSTILYGFKTDSKKYLLVSSALKYKVKSFFNVNLSTLQIESKEFGNSKNYFTLGNTNFYYNKKHILTCCINRRRHNDHVIDSLEQPLDITIPKVNYMASDHKPILVIVKE